MIVSITYRNEEVKTKELKVSSSGRMVRLWMAFIFSIVSFQPSQIFQKVNKIHTRMAEIKKTDNNKCCQECGEIGTSHTANENEK